MCVVAPHLFVSWQREVIGVVMLIRSVARAHYYDGPSFHMQNKLTLSSVPSPAACSRGVVKSVAVKSFIHFIRSLIQIQAGARRLKLGSNIDIFN